MNAAFGIAGFLLPVVGMLAVFAVVMIAAINGAVWAIGRLVRYSDR